MCRGKGIRHLLIGASVVLLAPLSACTLVNEGAAPDLAKIDFPVSILTRGDDLVVINSNFNLSFNGAVAQRFSRQAVEAALLADQDGIVPVSELLTAPRQAVILDSHGARSALSLDGRFVYIPVRSQPSLTVLRLEDTGGLDCGQGEGQRCQDSSRLGIGTSDNERQVSFPSGPVDIAVGDFSRLGGRTGDEYMVVGHGGGRASLFLRESGTDPDVLPQLVDVIDGLPASISAVSIQPETDLVWVTSSFSGDASDGELARLGVIRDSVSPTNSFLFQVDTRRVDGASANRDTRDVAFSNRAGDSIAYVVARNPEALWVLDLSESEVTLAPERIVPLGVGPTEVVEAELEVLGAVRRLLLIPCFNSREVYVVDPSQGRTLSVIRGSATRVDQDRDSSRLSGPYTLAFAPRTTLGGVTLPARLYVADFRASTIRVVDFSPLISCLERALPTMGDGACEPTVIGTIGEPRPVGDLL